MFVDVDVELATSGKYLTDRYDNSRATKGIVQQIYQTMNRQHFPKQVTHVCSRNTGALKIRLLLLDL